MNCIVCGIAKNENQYIYEWAKCHLQIGFSHIHIYDNNDMDGERITDVFEGTEIENCITIHDVRGKTCMQLEVYQQCYELEDFDWCAFIDIDEFITFTNQQMTISEFLKDKLRFEAVHLNWLCYGDDGQLRSDGRGVLERIKHPIQPLDFKAQYITIPENDHIKSIIKKGLKIDWRKDNVIIHDAQPHTPYGLMAICDEKGNIVENIPWHPMSFGQAYVAHYITKTIDEYSVKVNRRSADSNSYYHNYSRFFTYNRLSFSKLRIIGNPSVCKSILIDRFKWWNFVHGTLLCNFYKQYKRLMSEEKLYEYKN